MANSEGFIIQFNYCQCKGCDETLKKVQAIEGVNSIHIDENKRELTVWGLANPETIIKTIERRHKLAKFLREIDESPPEIGLQQNLVPIDQWEVAPILPGLINDPVDEPMGKRIDDCPEHDHDLELLEDYNKPFKCNGCREDGFASAYRCKHCSFELHEDCKDPIPEVTHEFFEGSTFEYRQEAARRKACDACGMEIHGHF